MTGALPPHTYEMRPRRHLLPAGTQLWRVHKAKRPATQFNPVSADAHFGGHRFDGTSYDPYGFLYAATNPTTALAETLLRSLEFDPRSGGLRLVPYAAVKDKSLSVVRTRRDLELISLVSEEDLAAVCADAWLLESEGDRYAKTRRWASEMRAQDPLAAGLVWQSRRHRPRLAAVLFQDRCELGGGGPAESAGHEGGSPLLDPVPLRGIPDMGSASGVGALNELLAPLRAAVVPPWPE